jgi:hypothetical protein
LGPRRLLRRAAIGIERRPKLRLWLLTSRIAPVVRLLLGVGIGAMHTRITGRRGHLSTGMTSRLLLRRRVPGVVRHIAAVLFLRVGIRHLFNAGRTFTVPEWC